MGGVLNIIIGIVFIIGGLTGNLALIGTNSGPWRSWALFLVIWVRRPDDPKPQR